MEMQPPPPRAPHAAMADISWSPVTSSETLRPPPPRAPHASNSGISWSPMTSSETLQSSLPSLPSISPPQPPQRAPQTMHTTAMRKDTIVHINRNPARTWDMPPPPPPPPQVPRTLHASTVNNNNNIVHFTHNPAPTREVPFPPSTQVSHTEMNSTVHLRRTLATSKETLQPPPPQAPPRVSHPMPMEGNNIRRTSREHTATREMPRFPPPPPQSQASHAEAMDMNNVVYLVTALSDPNLVRGDENKLLMQARQDKHFGADFVSDALISRDVGDFVNFLILPHTDFMLVIFPGSKMVSSDWTTVTGNLRIEQLDYLNGRVHQGFWNKVETYWENLAAIVNSAPEKRLIFAGHSRGGACAVISALRYGVEFGRRRVAAVVTIGQPRCVDERLAFTVNEMWGERYIRVVTSTDVVPSTPPKELGYKHAGNLWLYDKHGRVTKNPAREVKREMRRNDRVSIMETRKREVVFALLQKVGDAKEGHDIKCYEQRVHDVNELRNKVGSYVHRVSDRLKHLGHGK